MMQFRNQFFIRIINFSTLRRMLLSHARHGNEIAWIKNEFKVHNLMSCAMPGKKSPDNGFEWDEKFHLWGRAQFDMKEAIYD